MKNQMKNPHQPLYDTSRFSFIKQNKKKLTPKQTPATTTTTLTLLSSILLDWTRTPRLNNLARSDRYSPLLHELRLYTTSEKNGEIRTCSGRLYIGTAASDVGASGSPDRTSAPRRLTDHKQHRYREALSARSSSFFSCTFIFSAEWRWW